MLFVLAARVGLAAMLMIALAVFATPTSGLAGTPDAHSEIVVVANSDVANAGHAAHEDTPDRSCHPDPTCSPAAILVTRPIFGAQGFRAVRQPLAKTAIGGKNAPVDLPPPRVWDMSQPNTLKYPQT
ncbi:hypothetical protein [Rhodosalinus sediminis]|uniref:hypothetical protein n=1 Tax=Rhodosalinus sediminis TaxID=1940533 RepID=UPI0013144322|nr:hypothetical protein [Rhodosalinus sediminis]